MEGESQARPEDECTMVVLHLLVVPGTAKGGILVVSPLVRVSVDGLASMSVVPENGAEVEMMLARSWTVLWMCAIRFLRSETLVLTDAIIAHTSSVVTG